MYSNTDAILFKLNITAQPVAATVRAEPHKWDYYKKGVISCENSGCSTVNHVVLVVGYTPTYWII